MVLLTPGSVPSATPAATTMSKEHFFLEKHGVLNPEREYVLRALNLLLRGVQVSFTINGRKSRRKITLTPALEVQDRTLICDPGITYNLWAIENLVCEYRETHRGSLICGAQVSREYGRKGFSFCCQGPSGDSFTKCIALVLAYNGNIAVDMRAGAKGLSCRFDTPSGPPANTLDALRRPAPLPTTRLGPTVPGAMRGGDRGSLYGTGRERDFASFLAPTGVGHLYEAAFNTSGLEYQDLAVLNRSDLEVLLGIENRLHQIKVLTQIRLQFRTGSGIWPNADNFDIPSAGHSPVGFGGWAGSDSLLSPPPHSNNVRAQGATSSGSGVLHSTPVATATLVDPENAGQARDMSQAVEMTFHR